MSYLFTHNSLEPNIYSLLSQVTTRPLNVLIQTSEPSRTPLLASRDERLLQWSTVLCTQEKMKKGRGKSSCQTARVLCFLYYVATSKVEVAGFFNVCVCVGGGAFGCPRETLSTNREARIDMNSCCSIPPQLRSFYCKCCLNTYPFTLYFVSWTFIITSLLYSSHGENEQYTYYTISFYHYVTAAPGDYWETFLSASFRKVMLWHYTMGWAEQLKGKKNMIIQTTT